MRFKRIYDDHLLGHYTRVYSKPRGPYMTKRKKEERRHARQIAFCSFFLVFMLTIIYQGGQAKAMPSTVTSYGADVTPIVVRAGSTTKTVEGITPTPTPTNQYDFWIDKYSKKFGKTTEKYLYTKQLLHCMIYRESRYGENKGMGDGGKAGGVMQFWESTFIGYRKLMIKAGFTDVIGSRDNPEQAISTAAWAVNNNRAKAWGPVARGECK